MPRGVSRYDEARLQGRLWTPMAVQADVRYWIDATPRNRTMSGTAPTVYPDISGRGSALSNVGGTRAWSDAGLNGRPAFDFQGGQAYGAAAVACGSASSFIAASVFTMRSGSANQVRIMSCGNAQDWDNSIYAALMVRESPFGLRLDSTWSSGIRLTTTSGVAYDTPMLFVVYRDGTNAYHRLNGAQTAGPTTQALTLGTVTFRIGTYLLSTSDTTSRLDGLVGEQILTVGWPGIAGLHRIEGYLAHKWGLAGSLAGTHPYRNTPPLIGG
jgi:hypothetical protein